MSLGLFLLNKILVEERLPDFTRLKAQLFEGDAERQTFTYIQSHVERYNILPTLELTRGEMTRAGHAFPNPPTRDTFAFYHDRVISRAVRGLISNMTERVSGQIDNPDFLPAIESVNQFTEELANIRTESQRELVQMSDLGDIVLSEISRTRTSHGVTGVPTSFPTLDRATRGLQPGNIYVILARPKMGKTTIMLRMADAAHLAGFTPLVVSMEMNQEQMARRHFAMRAGLDMGLLQRGLISTFAEDMIREKITEMRGQARYHFVEGQFKSDVQDVASMVQALRPHVLLVDAGYLLKMRKSQAKARWDLTTDIAMALKSIASVSTIPVVVSFQFNREVKKGANNADMANIQLADAIGQLASVAIGLFEPRDTESVLSQRRRLIKIIGGREGEGDVEDFEINWDFRRMRFDEIVETPYQNEYAHSEQELVDD